VGMFEKLEVPVLGIVENMSYLLMPDGSKLAVFGTGGGEHLAFRTGTPFLGSIPLDPEIGQGGDIGSPVVLLSETNPSAEAMREVARKVAAQASIKAYEQEGRG